MLEEEYHLVIEDFTVDAEYDELEFEDVSVQQDSINAFQGAPQASLAPPVLIAVVVGGLFISAVLYLQNLGRKPQVDTRTVAVCAEMNSCSNLRQVQGILNDYFSDKSQLRGDDMGLSLLSLAGSMLMKALEMDNDTMDNE